MISALRAPLLLAAGIAMAWPNLASAQDFPTKPIKIIVPFGAGGPADVFSRQLGQYLSESLKQPVVIEDKPGAGSIIGTDQVAKSRARRLHAAGDVEHPHGQRVAACPTSRSR